MAARKSRAREPIEEDLEDLRPDELDFLSFVDDIGPTGSIVEVYRIPRSGDPEWMDVLAFDIIRDGGQSYIRETYGAGKYKLVFKNTGKKYLGQKTLVIGAIPAAPAAAVAVNNGADMRFEFLTAQMAQDRALMFKLIENIGKGGPTPTDPAAMLTAVVTAFSVLKGASDPAAAAGNPMKQLKDTMELMANAKDIFGGESKEENLYTVVKELGNKFLGSGAAIPGGPAAGVLPGLRTVNAGTNFKVSNLAGPGAPGGPAGVPGAPGGSAAAKSSESQANAAQWIAAGLAYLKQKAKLGKDVELYQDLIFDHDDEPQFAALLQGIQAGATFENLLQFDPEIAETPALREWFRKLYEAVHKEIFESVDTGGAGGDTNNPPGNAAPGAGGSQEP